MEASVSDLIRGAWVGHALQSNPAEIIRRATIAKLNRLCIVCNDASDQASGPAAFKPYNTDFTALSAQLRAVGFAVDAMLWLVADAGYIAAMNAFDATWADRKCLDVEEPWVKRDPSHRHDTYESLAAQVAGPYVATAIAYTDFAKAGALTPVAWLPQVYCTQTAAEKWGVNPRTSPTTAVARYRQHFPDAPIECAHAAYDVAPGTIAAAVNAAGPYVAGHWWWSLGQASEAVLREIGATA
jgi:hypothetical protein